MLGFLKKRINILSCSKSLTGVVKSELVFPSEVTKVWLKNRKKQLKNYLQKKLIYYILEDSEKRKVMPI